MSDSDLTTLPITIVPPGLEDKHFLEQAELVRSLVAAIPVMGKMSRRSRDYGNRRLHYRAACFTQHNVRAMESAATKRELLVYVLSFSMPTPWSWHGPSCAWYTT